MQDRDDSIPTSPKRTAWNKGKLIGAKPPLPAAAEISDDRDCQLLRVRRKRPPGHAAEQRDELAALHSITSSASASSLVGIDGTRHLGSQLFERRPEAAHFVDGTRVRVHTNRSLCDGQHIGRTGHPLYLRAVAMPIHRPSNQGGRHMRFEAKTLLIQAGIIAVALFVGATAMYGWQARTGKVEHKSAVSAGSLSNFIRDLNNAHIEHLPVQAIENYN